MEEQPDVVASHSCSVAQQTCHDHWYAVDLIVSHVLRKRGVHSPSRDGCSTMVCVCYDVSLWPVLRDVARVLMSEVPSSALTLTTNCAVLSIASPSDQASAPLSTTSTDSYSADRFVYSSELRSAVAASSALVLLPAAKATAVHTHAHERVLKRLEELVSFAEDEALLKQGTPVVSLTCGIADETQRGFCFTDVHVTLATRREALSWASSLPAAIEMKASLARCDGKGSDAEHLSTDGTCAFWNPLVSMVATTWRSSAQLVTLAADHTAADVQRFASALMTLVDCVADGLSLDAIEQLRRASLRQKDLCPPVARTIDVQQRLHTLRMTQAQQELSWVKWLLGRHEEADCPADVVVQLLASPPPRYPPLSSNTFTSPGAAAAKQSRELTVVDVELVSSVEDAGNKALGSNSEPSLPNASEFVAVHGTTSDEASPASRRVADDDDVFQRLTRSGAPAPSRLPRTLSPARAPFVAGAVTSAARAAELQAAQALIATLRGQIKVERDRSQHLQLELLREREARAVTGEEQLDLAEAKRRMHEMQERFEQTVFEMTRDAESKLTSKEVEIVRLRQRLAPRESEAGSAAERRSAEAVTAVATMSPAISGELRAAQSALTKATEERRQLVEQLSNLQIESDTAVRRLEHVVQQQETKRVELEKQLRRAVDEKEQLESRIHISREAMEREIARLSSAVQLLQDDKRNLVLSLKAVEKARHAEMPKGGAAAELDSERLAELTALLDSARQELARARTDRDLLLADAKEKDSQLSTLRAAVEMMSESRAALPSTRVSSGGASLIGGASVGRPLVISGAANILHSVQRRVHNAAPIAASRAILSNSPVRPGMAYYVLQEKIESSGSPRGR